MKRSFFITVALYFISILMMVRCAPPDRNWSWKNPYVNNEVLTNDNGETNGSSGGGVTNFWGDITNIPQAHNVLTYKFVNRTYGAFSDDQIYWSFNGITNSFAESPTFDMPAGAAGRMYFYLGSPHSQYVDFIEFTITSTAWYGNTTRVDWFGFPIAIRLICDDGYDEELGEDYSMFTMDRDTIFQLFKDEVPAEFKPLAEVEYPYRIVAPQHYAGFQSGGANENYFSSYVDQVWATQGFSIPKPTTVQVFGCSGPLATDSPKSAALNRHTALLPQAQWDDSGSFYQAAPANYYAKFFHTHGLQSKAYGFPYDDNGGWAAYTGHNNPKYLIIAIGY